MVLDDLSWSLKATTLIASAFLWEKIHHGYFDTEYLGVDHMRRLFRLMVAPILLPNPAVIVWSPTDHVADSLSDSHPLSMLGFPEHRP